MLSWGLWKGGIRSVGPLIPIRLVTFVSALFAKGILVGVDEVAVPGEEIVLFRPVKPKLEEWKIA